MILINEHEFICIINKALTCYDAGEFFSWLHSASVLGSQWMVESKEEGSEE